MGEAPAPRRGEPGAGDRWEWGSLGLTWVPSAVGYEALRSGTRELQEGEPSILTYLGDARATAGHGTHGTKLHYVAKVFFGMSIGMSF